MAFHIKYRVETRKIKASQNPHHYLVRQSKVNNRKCVVTTYLRSGKTPAKEEIITFLASHIHEIEDKMTMKYLQACADTMTTAYLDSVRTEDIEHLRYLYNHLKYLIPADELACFEKEAEYQYIHGTTAIEGNTLSYGETNDFLEYDIVPSGKSARELFEIRNYISVKAYRNRYTGRITLTFMKKLHSLVMANILVEPGMFRTSDNIIISGYDYQVTPALLIEDELTSLIAWYYQNINNGSNPFECAILFHYRFETIHPFPDGNGRVGRELLNYLLEKSGYPRMVIAKEKRNEYLSALRCGNKDDNAGMVQKFADLMLYNRLRIMKENFRQQIDRRIRESQKPGMSPALEEFL